jgi:DNA-binding CsgD family transcriptional regulator
MDNSMKHTLLTDKEREALSLIAQGHDAKSAARLLSISTHTIYERLRRAREKLGTANSREAARAYFGADSTTNENLVCEKLVLADIAYAGSFSEVLDNRATADSMYAPADGQFTYRASSFRFSPHEYLPLRKPGEMDVHATTAERLRAIGELTTKLAFAFVAVCLSAMVLSNLIGRG